MIIVSAYCRVSTDKLDQANSFTHQIEYFTQFINGNLEWKMGEIYFDEGITGTSIKKRAGFNKMISDALEGKFNLIITKEVSRFARNTVDTLTYTRLLKENGIGVYFISDNINTLDKDGELRLTIMASLAQEESRKTSERVKWGQARSMEQGIVFGSDLLGYSVKNGILSINKEEAETVKLIFNKFVIEGKGTLKIANELNSLQIKPKKALKWSNSTILKILKNEKYVGDLCQKKTYTPNFLTHEKRINRGEMVYIKHHHQPIISRATWQTALAELSRRSKAKKTKYSNKYWCSGKIICAECGKSFIPRVKRLKNGTKYVAWRCLASSSFGTKKPLGCNNKSINNTTLLLCMGKLINPLIKNKKEIISDAIERIKNLKTNDKNSIKTALNNLNQKKNRLIDAYSDEIISKDSLKIRTQSIDNQIQSLLIQQDSISTNSKERIEKISEKINEIMEFSVKSQLIYREHIEIIAVNRDKSLTVQLKSLPYKIKITYIKSGKAENQAVEIETIKFIDN